jgi:hypothetical protein
VGFAHWRAVGRSSWTISTAPNVPSVVPEVEPGRQDEKAVEVVGEGTPKTKED